MATLYITEFRDLAGPSNGMAPPWAQQPPVAEQTVAITGASAQSAAFSGSTRYIRVHADAICSIEVGPAPVATTAKARMAASTTEYFGVKVGDQIAVISNT